MLSEDDDKNHPQPRDWQARRGTFPERKERERSASDGRLDLYPTTLIGARGEEHHTQVAVKKTYPPATTICPELPPRFKDRINAVWLAVVIPALTVVVDAVFQGRFFFFAKLNRSCPRYKKAVAPTMATAKIRSRGWFHQYCFRRSITCRIKSCLFHALPPSSTQQQCPDQRPRAEPGAKKGVARASVQK